MDHLGWDRVGRLEIPNPSKSVMHEESVSTCGAKADFGMEHPGL